MITEQIKKHPVMTVGAVGIGCLILFMLISSGGSSNSSDPSQPSPDAALAANTSLQAATIKAGSDLATAQLAYKGNLDQLTAQQNIAQLGTNADLLKTYSNNDTSLQVTGINAGVDLHKIDAMTAMQLASYSHDTDIAAIGAGVNMAQIGANRDISLAQTGAMVAIQQYAGDVQKFLAQTSADSQFNLAETAAHVRSSELKAQTAQQGIKTGGGIVSSLLGFLF